MPSTFDVEKMLMNSANWENYGDPAERFSVASDDKMVPHTRQVSNDRLYLWVPKVARGTAE